MPSPNDTGPGDVRPLVREVYASLDPLDPEEGVKRYLRRRRSEVEADTRREYRRKLNHFIEFCSLSKIENLNELNGRTIDDYQVWRREESSDQVDRLGSKTMRDDMYLFRAFLSYLESIEAVRPGISELVTVPELGAGEGVRDIELPPARVQRILEHLEKFKYGHREHVVWLIHCRTGRRPGDIHSLDVNDLQHATDGPYITFRHRPDEGTRLKNGAKSEGEVAIPDTVGEVLDDYIESCRVQATDDYDREPLLTSKQGRLSKSVMRRYFYKWTRPCQVTGNCPHNRDIDDCLAAKSVDKASQCPSSRPPYAVRHGYITELRRTGVPKSVVSDRCDVSEAIIDKHYDERTVEDRRKLQREILAKVTEESSAKEGGYMES